MHLAGYDAAILKALPICKPADGAPSNRANNSSLFKCFAGSRMMRCLTPLRPPLGMIQRRVRREVTSMTSVRTLLDLYGNAAYWIRFAAGTLLEPLIGAAQRR